MDIFTIGCYTFSILNLLIFALLLWGRKDQTVGNKIFGFYILLFSMPLFLNLMVFIGFLDIHYYFLCLFPAFLVGPMAYHFCLLYIKPDHVWKRTIFLHYVSAIALTLVLSLLTVCIHQGWLDSSFPLFKGSGIPDSFRSIVVMHGCLYHVYCWYLSKQFLKSSLDHPESVKKRIYWIHDFFKTMFVICILFVACHSIRVIIVGYSAVGSSVITPIILSLSYFLILNKCIAYVPVFSETLKSPNTQEPFLIKEKVSEEKRSSLLLSDEQLTSIELKLAEVLGRNKLFKDPELNLNSLSLQIDIAPRLLSQFVSQRYKVHFSDFINKYRVEESMNMMQEPEMRNLKLEAIAEASGFNSRASFFSIFKKLTGRTPAAFRKEMINQ